MNARDFLDLQAAYQGVYQELDEVRGGGRIDPVSDFPHHGERARSPKDAGLKMSPIARAEARANALKKRNDPEATKRANRIQSRFVGPTKRGISRAIDASNAARSAEKKRLMNPQESYEYDTSDAIREKIVVGVSKYLEPDMKKRGENNEKAIKDMKKTKAHKDMVATARNNFDEEVESDVFTQVLEYLVAEGYADTNENAIAIMANMSEEWREEILDEAVRGSERSIANKITGNDIRGVSRGGKTVYKKPKWKDEVETRVQGGSQLRRQGETENTNDRRDRERIEVSKKSINRMNAAKNIEDKQADGDYENSIDHSNPSKGKSGYMEVPTDHRARKRRASGR